MILLAIGMLLSNLCSLREIPPQVVHKLMVADNVVVLLNMMKHDVDGQAKGPPKHQVKRQKACGLVHRAVIAEGQHLEHLWPLGLALRGESSYHATKSSVESFYDSVAHGVIRSCMGLVYACHLKKIFDEPALKVGPLI